MFTYQMNKKMNRYYGWRRRKFRTVTLSFQSRWAKHSTFLVSTSTYALNEDQARSFILNSASLDFYRAHEDRNGDSGTTCNILEPLNHTHRDKVAEANQNVR